MSQREGYFVFFMPGARGRLFGNIIYKLINNIKADFPITEYNSAHLRTDDIEIDMAMNSVDDVMHFTTGTSIEDTKLVIASHLYPEEGIENFSKITNKGVILINVKKENIPEIHINAVIKNIFPKLQALADGKVLSDKFHKEIEAYQERYFRLNNRELDSRVLTDAEIRREFLEFFSGEFYVNRTAPFYKNFIDTSVKENDQIYIIDYDGMFDKNSEGQYSTLVRLSKWLGVEYNDDVHKIYADYEIGQVKLFEKYCPWFLTGEENEPR